MHRFYSIGSVKLYKSMIWLNKNQNNLLKWHNDVVMYFVGRVNQGESLVNWLNWLTEPPALCWSLIMRDLSHGSKDVYCTRPKAFRTGRQSCSMQDMSLSTKYNYVNHMKYYISCINQMMQKVTGLCNIYLAVINGSKSLLFVLLSLIIYP